MLCDVPLKLSFCVFVYLWRTVLSETEAPDSDIRCYECNSLHDPRCADPFDSFSIGEIRCKDKPVPEHLIDHLNPNRERKPVLCRKTIQLIGNHTRVIRGCGYIRDERDDKKCYQRSGSKDIKLTFCSCTSSLCNSSSHTEASGIILGILVISGLIGGLFV